MPNLAEGDIHFEYADYLNVIDKYKDGVNFIYLDPPYAGTKQYNVSRNFNHTIFWQIVRELSKNNYVLVSEQNAPDDFACMKTIGVIRQVGASKERRHSVQEKLFFYPTNSKMSEWISTLPDEKLTEFYKPIGN